MNTFKAFSAAVAIAATGTVLTACGSTHSATSSQSSPVSAIQRAKNIAASAKECKGLLPIAKQVTPIATGLQNKTLAPKDVPAKLAPIQAELAKYTNENPTLPISAAIKTLTADIANVQKNAPKDAAGIKAAVATFTKDGSAVASACLGG